MAMPMAGIKFDDGSSSFVTNCFPVKNFRHISEEGGGAWLVAHRVEQRKQFKALLCSKPRTYNDIRNQRKKADLSGTAFSPPAAVPFDVQEGEEKDDYRCLDGFFLMKHCAVSDPTHLCSVNISGQQLTDVKEEDLVLFDNVAYVNAAENFLTIDQFKNFSIIRELELPLNGIRGVRIQPNSLQNLEMLDLSYNNLSTEDVLPLGTLPALKVLHVTGNCLRHLPMEMAYPVVLIDELEKIDRFAKLEVLLADENWLSNPDTFAALAGLPRLRHLNLSKNEVSIVPQLMLVQGQHKPIDPDRSKGQRSARRSARREKLAKKLADSAVAPADDSANELCVAAKSLSKESLEMASRPAASLERDIPEKSPIVSELQDELVGMSLGELNLGDLEAKVDEDVEKERPSEYSDAVPFPALRFIDLSYNKILNEQQLMALSVWPALAELVIHSNPVVTERSSDPPLLKKLLTDKLGIHIQRMLYQKKPAPIQKPDICIKQKTNRKIVTHIQKIPKCNVEQLLAIECNTRQIADRMQPSPLLPPIGRGSADLRGDDEDYDRLPMADEVHLYEDEEALPGEPIFMTQGGEPTVGESASKPEPTDKLTEERPPSPVRQPIPCTDERYRGYEALLEDDDDDMEFQKTDVPIQNDVLGNVRSLQFLLNHPLVFRDSKHHTLGVHTHPTPSKAPHYTVMEGGRKKQEAVQDALMNLRDRTAIKEAPLHEVLANPRRYRKDFPNAAKLLGDIKGIYDQYDSKSDTKSRTLQTKRANATKVRREQNTGQGVVKATRKHSKTKHRQVEKKFQAANAIAR